MQHIADHPLTLTLDHKGKGRGKGKEKVQEEGSEDEEVLVEELEEANSKELEQASLKNLLAKGGKGGEMVENKDLWECLFGAASRGAQKGRAIEGFDREVDRHLRAEAADMRRVEDEDGGGEASGSRAS
jgi:hypothetical protein